MKSFSEKLKDARSEAGITQAELAEKIGVSVRSVQAYEQGVKSPRQNTMIQLAKALNVSYKFLSDETCENPMDGIEKTGYIEEARQRYGSSGVRDINELLSENQALFAGGSLSQEDKDAFFQAVMTAYVTCKEQAKYKFGKKE